MDRELEMSPWDVVDYLKTPQDIALYLEAVFEDGDPNLIAATLGDIARSKGMTAIAAETGLGRESLYKALSPEGNPGFAYVLSVLKALGLRLSPTVSNADSVQDHYTSETWDSSLTLAQDSPIPIGIESKLKEHPQHGYREQHMAMKEAPKKPSRESNIHHRRNVANAKRQ